MKKFLLILLILFQAGFAFPQDMLSKMKSDEVITINDKEFYVHQVKRGQTLFMISKAYQVEVQDIINENPEVKEGLNAGMKLKIPKKTDPGRKNGNVRKAEPQPVTVQEQVQARPPVPAAVPCGKDSENMKPVYNIALMMPLALDQVVAIDPGTVSSEDITGLRSLQFLPFYEGFLMAMDSLKKLGFKLKVYVYDVEKDTLKTKKLLRNPEMKNMDLIIGLLYNKTFQVVADFALKNSIPIVNPLSERDQITQNNPFVIKVRPSLKSQSQQLVQYIGMHYGNASVVILSNKAERIGSLPDSVVSKLHASSTFSSADAISHLKKDGDNVLIVYSDNKPFILDAITKIHEVRNEYSILVIGLPRWNDVIEGIENDYLVNLKAHVMSPYFINYEDPDIRKFARDYQDKYKTDPDPLAFQGFDVAFYFSNALKLYGKNFESCLPGLQMNSLQTRFEFGNRQPKNGMENLHWEMYMYDNYRLVPLSH
ncbi:MAG: amino acid ABC transporter substrate-binding protein [Syntrophothermus sp.]